MKLATIIVTLAAVASTAFAGVPCAPEYDPDGRSCPVVNGERRCC